MLLFDKILLLVKEITNPSLFVYHCFHYLNKRVPLRLARVIAKHNKLNKAKGEKYIQTDDGSDQVVHPDIVEYQNRLVLICTPYPYGMEEYENPCLYIGNNLEYMKPLLCPIDNQGKQMHGVHMSDPCIVSSDNQLYCIYRETKFKEDFIYLKKVTIDEREYVGLSERRVLMQSKESYVLSPAVVTYDNYLYMYYVGLLSGNSSELMLVQFDKERLESRHSAPITIQNEPLGFYLWHIGVNSAADYGKCIKRGDALTGLFLYLNRQDSKNVKLFIAVCEDIGLNKWMIEKEVKMPKEVGSQILFPYKSCFIPKTEGHILLSFRDTMRRNRLYTIDNQD